MIRALVTLWPAWMMLAFMWLLAHDPDASRVVHTFDALTQALDR